MFRSVGWRRSVARAGSLGETDPIPQAKDLSRLKPMVLDNGPRRALPTNHLEFRKSRSTWPHVGCGRGRMAADFGNTALMPR